MELDKQHFLNVDQPIDCGTTDRSKDPVHCKKSCLRLYYSFRHSQKCFLSQLTEFTGHVWRLGIHVSMYDGLPSRRSLLRHSRGLSDDLSTRQVRAVRSVRLQEEQQAAPSHRAQKPFSSTFTDGTIIKVQTEQIQTYCNMWGNNWLSCCWLVEASDRQMDRPITNHLYYVILRLLVDDRGINRVIKYWWRRYLAPCERDSTISCCCSWIAFFFFRYLFCENLASKKKKNLHFWFHIFIMS